MALCTENSVLALHDHDHYHYYHNTGITPRDGTFCIYIFAVRCHIWRTFFSNILPLVVSLIHRIYRTLERAKASIASRQLYYGNQTTRTKMEPEVPISILQRGARSHSRALIDYFFIFCIRLFKLLSRTTARHFRTWIYWYFGTQPICCTEMDLWRWLLFSFWDGHAYKADIYYECILQRICLSFRLSGVSWLSEDGICYLLVLGFLILGDHYW